MMPVTAADKRTIFRKLHETGCFALPNPWDVGSARALQHLGFKAIASTSAGFAWSIGRVRQSCHRRGRAAASRRAVRRGRPAGQRRFRGRLCRQGGESRVNVARAVKTGVAGLSIEDSTGDAAKPLVRARARDRTHQGGAARDRCRQRRRAADRTLRSLSGRAGRSEPGDRPAEGLCGRRCGLPLCTGYQDQGADRRGREGGRSQSRSIS